MVGLLILTKFMCIYIYTTPLVPILSKIPATEQCRAPRDISSSGSPPDGSAKLAKFLRYLKKVCAKNNLQYRDHVRGFAYEPSFVGIETIAL